MRALVVGTVDDGPGRAGLAHFPQDYLLLALHGTSNSAKSRIWWKAVSQRPSNCEVQRDADRDHRNDEADSAVENRLYVRLDVAVGNSKFFNDSGGRGGIRTHGTLAGTPVFKTGALNHSATLPDLEIA
jgi:hypothetical protein